MRDFAMLPLCGLVIALIHGGSACSWAELPSPRFDILRPAGLAAGGEVEVTIVGSDLEDCERLLLEHPGITAEFVKEKTFKIRCGADVPAGTYEVNALGRFGVSNSRLLLVTQGLTDIAETEPNNAPTAAQTVSLNSAINGQADGNNRDLFRVSLRQGQRVTFDCWSARLETEMDPVLAVFNDAGQQVASNSDYFGRDSLIDLIAPADGDYLVEVRDLTYRGGYPYRLLIHDRPRVENVFPRAVRSGETVELTALGGNLGAGALPTKLEIEGVPLLQKTLQWQAPADLLTLGLFRERYHTLQHSVLPTAATCTLVGTQALPFDADPCVMVVTDQPTTIEQEPNNSKEQPQALSLPIVVSGRFDVPRDADWYQFETDETGGAYGFDVYAERIDGRCDPYLAIYDEKGQRVFEIDDFGHRIAAFDGHLRDPSGMTNLPAKKQYRLLVQDRYQRGGPRCQYVLSIRKAHTDFFAASMHSQTNAAGLNLRKGGATYFDVILHHQDGGNKFPVTITAEGLPPGVQMAPTTITNNSRGTVVLWAEENAGDFSGPVEFLARSKHDDRELTRRVRPHSRAYAQTGSRALRRQMLAVGETSPYALRLEPERLSVQAGKSIEVKIVAQRLWQDFKGDINYQPLNFPGNFQLGNGTISAGNSDKMLTINVQANTQPGDYTLTVLGQAQVPFEKTPSMKTPPNTLVSIPSRPITITVVAAEKP